MACVLRGYCRNVGDPASCHEVSREQVKGFLVPRASSYRETKYCGLADFYRYAIPRGFATLSPLPAQADQSPQPMVSYVYSREEIRRLLETAATYWKRVFCLRLDSR